MPQSPGPRQRLLTSAIALMCERGVHATGLADLLEHSGTARGSVYQHFPRGKSELMTEATYLAGRHITRQMETLLESHEPAGAVAAFIDDWVSILTVSEYEQGCPIVAAAQAGSSEPEIQNAAAKVYADWIERLAASLTQRGAGPAEARTLSSLAVSAIEGAITQSRSGKSVTPLLEAKAVLVPLFTRETPVTS